MRHASVRYKQPGALLLLVAALLATRLCAAQQDTVPAPPETVESALQSMAGQAAVIFIGSVTCVTEKAGGATEVLFAVEDAVRGAEAGGTYTMTLSPWAGGAERYRVGERALFLLHAPSKAGYSSPVAGERGIVPLAGDRIAGSVDLRWIAADVLRPAPVLTADSPASSTVPTVHAHAIAATPTGDAARLLRAGNVTGQDVHSIDRDLVTGMLRTWNAAEVASKVQAR